MSALPTVTRLGHEWFVDDRLQQYRQTDNPHVFLSFAEMEDRLENTPPHDAIFTIALEMAKQEPEAGRKLIQTALLLGFCNGSDLEVFEESYPE